MNVKTVVIDESKIDDCLVELLDADFLAVDDDFLGVFEVSDDTQSILSKL
jgi:hypothetical protein